MPNKFLSGGRGRGCSLPNRYLPLLLLLLPHWVAAQICLSNPSPPNPGSMTGISNVSIGALNNASPIEQGHVDFSPLSAAVVSGQTSVINLDFQSPSNWSVINIWIDWNGNSDLNEPGERITAVAVATNSLAVNIPVPLTAVGGLLRMRIAQVDAFGILPTSACDTVLGDVEDYLLDVLHLPMAIDSIRASHVPDLCVHPASPQQQLIRLAVYPQHFIQAQVLDSVGFSTNGSSNPAADIAQASLYSTGSNPNFNDRVLLGTVSNPNGSFNIDASSTSILAGTPNYFWLTVDIPATANLGNVVDAEVLSLHFDSAGVALSKQALDPAPSGNLLIDLQMDYGLPMATHKWLSLQNRGLDFNCPSPQTIIHPTVLPGSYQVGRHTTASIADSLGELQYFSDGQTLQNRFGEVSPNGDSLSGRYNARQPAIFVPDPGNPDRFYLFAASHPPYGNFQVPNRGLSYSVVDNSLDGGRGDIVAGLKNVSLMDTSSGVMAAVQHCNGEDYWLVSYNNHRRSFFVYRIGASGIGPPSIYPDTVVAIGSSSKLKFSPNGRHLTLSKSIYDFNCETGEICNHRELVIPTLWSVPPDTGISTWAFVYGASFSPDNSKLYLNLFHPSGPTMVRGRVIQFDLDDPTFPASFIDITDNTYVQSASQLGPDGKIYIDIRTGSGRDYLSVIEAPNQLGVACNYRDTLIDLQRNAVNGLPNFVESWLLDTAYIAPSIVSDFSVVPACANDTSRFSELGTTFSCPSYTWDFGDPGSGSANNSDLADPVHVFANPGAYLVTLIVGEACQRDTFQQLVNIGCPLDASELEFRAWPEEGPVVELEWSGLGELPVEAYTVLRSRDGSEFEEIRRLPAAGLQASTFRTQDPHPYFGQSWYQISYRDQGGENMYSEIRSVWVEPVNGLQVYPVPLRDFLQLSLYCGKAGPVQVRVYDALGRRVRGEDVEGESGENQMQLDLEGLSAGMYVLQVRGANGERMERKFVKE